MAKQNNIVREYKRIYGNLNELYRRVYASEQEYPVKTCINWFIDGVKSILDNQKLKLLLTAEHIERIVAMSTMLITTNLMDEEKAKSLNLLVKKLEVIKHNLDKEQTITK